MKSDWTAIIPAAGKSSRFGKAKTLADIKGHTQIDRIALLLDAFCWRGELVVLTGNKPAYMASHSLFRVWDAPPTGVVDAIARPLPFIRTKYTIIVWGDMLNIRPDTIKEAIYRHELYAKDQAPTIPVTVCVSPYTHFDADPHPSLWWVSPMLQSRNVHLSKVNRVLLEREGDKMPEIGTQDVGVFLFNTDVLKEFIDYLKAHPYRSKVTGEELFLPVFENCDVTLLPIAKEFERYSLNTPEDLKRVV